MIAPRQTISLVEYRRIVLPAAALSAEMGTLLWEHYGAANQIVDVAFPTPRTGNRWEITAQGWVGHIPLSPELHLLLQPRTALDNLFRMLGFAYRLEELHLLPGVIQSDTLRDFYEQLALLLAQRVLARSRRGLHHSYLLREEALPYVRGQVALRRQRPWQAELECRYEEQTVDVPDNQILAWTLRRISQSGLCGNSTQGTIRRAYHSLGAVTIKPFSARAAAGWLYTRLNEEYAALHALCRFFLAHSGPGHRQGEQEMIPFLVNMAQLYERFVAAWLGQHLPSPFRLQVQERVEVGGDDAALAFVIDMVLYGTAGEVLLVLDTKYKEDVTAADVQQAVTYAQLRGCRQAVLIYPQPPRRPFDAQIGAVRVRALTFALEGDLEAQGQAFVAALVLGA